MLKLKKKWAKKSAKVGEKCLYLDGKLSKQVSVQKYLQKT